MIENLKKLIDVSQNIVVFTGAGISVPSGIPDFRSNGGLYNQKTESIPAEVMLSHTYYVNHTESFYNYYKKNLIYKDAKPNVAHKYFAQLEKQGKVKAVVTQNIDGLHQLAGSSCVYELHGSVLRNYCENCKKHYDVDYILNSNGVPKCNVCGGIVKPDVVLYEESLNYTTLENSVNAIANSDLLIVVGTSLVVQPAASLINYRGGKLVLINKQPTAMDNLADMTINDDIVSVVEKLKSN